jgi:hypothetical protein
LTKQGRIPDAKMVKSYREGLVPVASNTNKPSISQPTSVKSSKNANMEYLLSYRWYYTRVKDSKTHGNLVTFKNDGTVEQPNEKDKWNWTQIGRDEILFNGVACKISVGQTIWERPDPSFGNRYLHRDEPIPP